MGLTGGLGSGKSTVAAMLQVRGAHVLAADELARGLMQPGSAVFDAIVERFGQGVLDDQGNLDRALLSRYAFKEGRVEELNAIVHPATIALQAELGRQLAARDPEAVLVVESALIFETRHSETKPNDAPPPQSTRKGQPGWRARFDKLILVTAPDVLKIERFVLRSSGPETPAFRAALESEARRRLARMIPDAVKAAQCDYIIANDGGLRELERRVDPVWRQLQALARSGQSAGD